MTEFNFPKIDLHNHLDGALRPETLYELCGTYGVTPEVPTIEEYIALTRKRAGCGSVNEYLKMFDLPCRVMQTREALERITFELGEDMANQGVVYSEIRFAPQQHVSGDLSQGDAIEAVIAGARRCEQMYPIRLGIIACMMSYGSETINWDANLETIDAASDWLGRGLVGIDLAGAEGIVPLSNFAGLFDRIRPLNIPITCHAGDSPGPDSVETAVFTFGASRIGHGHRLYYDAGLTRRIAKLGTVFEICPTSNVHCRTEPSYYGHPAKNMFDLGVKVTINTDNRFLSDVTLDKEYEHCLNDMGFEYKDLIRMNLNSINGAFCSESVKAPIRKELEALLSQ